ncbi:MAG TPA: hypothetical protein VGG38_12795 [Acidimicrobiales bacterium]|jgi:hypothetical protein
MNEEVRRVAARVAAFEGDAHALLESFEDAHRSRVITLGDVLGRLTSLNLHQEELFRQALRCAENAIFLASHIMAWAAAMDLYEENLASDGLAKVHAEYPKWAAHQTLDDLRENVKEYQLIEAGKRVKLLTNSQMKSLHGYLNTRNQAAHPTGFSPGINETLGYIEALLKLCAAINQKTL